MAKELNKEDLERVAGGKVNPNADGRGYNLDKIINDENWDALADWFMKKFKLYPDRRRAVKNDVNINDVDI
ncbi:MAG: hypothetical protein IJR80_07030 [Treponema sp.]|nr:hypothetical protein [Treponema sp.]